MTNFILPLLMAAPQGAEGAAGGGGALMTFLPFVAIIAIFYFLIIRPQNKKQKETQRMLSELKKGDKIVTIGGIHGTIQTVREQAQTLIVKVDENTKLEFSRSAVSRVETPVKESKETEEEEASAESK
ncbi:MAG: preprotein translocase subunit YajC [Treponema sp.]|jgi:preprotein translocase subunit YajC|nr:preprotein translocase subunit YajC [Treponema sp.]